MLIKTIKLTTTKKPSNNQLIMVEEIKEKLGLQYIERKNDSILQMLNKNECTHFLIVKKDKLIITDGNNDLFWHPNMSIIKIKAIQNGEMDPIIKAMDLQVGDSVLDCTLGFAADALVVSAFIGKNGKIIGTEANKYIAYLTQDGLQNYSEATEDMKSIMKRIKVINANYNDFLKSLDDNSFDVVYFDPMFKTPNMKSAFMNSIRPFAENSYLSLEIINEALRVARKRVVAKERMFSKELEDLGFKEFYGGGARGSIKYGVICKV